MAMTSKVGAETDSGLAARAAAIASIGAAMIHFAVIPVHFVDWVLSGLFFASVSAFQLIWAFLVWTRPPAALLAVGVMGNASLATLWVVSRTDGVPFGPHAGEPEVVHAAGICVLLLECYVVMGAAWAWMRGWRAEPVSGLRSALVLLAANSVVAVVVALGLASTLQNHDHHHPPAQAQTPEPSAVGADHDGTHQHPKEAVATKTSDHATEGFSWHGEEAR